MLSSEHKGTLKSLVGLASNTQSLDEVLVVLTENYQINNLYGAIALAQALRMDNQVTQAILKLEAVSTDVNLTSNYFTLLGDCYLQLEQYEKAKVAFSEGVILAPTDFFLNIRYISTLEWLGLDELALEKTRELHQIYQENADVTASLIMLEAKRKNYQEAKRLLLTLEGRETNHHILDTVSGEIYSHEKNYSKATEYFSAAYEKKPTELNLLNLARTLKFDKQNKKAEVLLENYLNSNPSNGKIRFLLAELYGNKDRVRKVEQYQALVSLAPKNAIVLNNLAWNQLKLGQKTAALKNIQKAYLLNPQTLAIQESYGVILVENGMLVEGLDMLERAIHSGSVDASVDKASKNAKALLEKKKVNK
jgi:predicted Zn-dependent protease